MKILMLGRWLPPPRHPVKATREYQFARHLAQTHQLTLAFITDNPDVAGPISVLRGEFGDLEFASVPRGWRSLAGAVSLATGESCTLSYFRSEALRTRLADRLRTTGYDAIFVSSSRMIQYALDVDPAIPLVVDYGEVDSEWWVRQAAQGSFPGTRFFKTEATRLRTAEAAAARRAVLRLAASPEAVETVKSFASDVPVISIPNGLMVTSRESSTRGPKRPTIVFNTSLDSEAEARNVIEFNRVVMSRVRSRVPAARFLVISREAAVSSRLAGSLPGAELATLVPDAVPLLFQGTVAAAPLRNGTDPRRAVLEPMAVGLPVVAAPPVLQRLAVTPGQELLLADDPSDFALKLIQLLENECVRSELAARGKDFVSSRYTWTQVGAQLTGLIDTLGQPPGPALPGTGPLAQSRI